MRYIEEFLSAIFMLHHTATFKRGSITDLTKHRVAFLFDSIHLQNAENIGHYLCNF